MTPILEVEQLHFGYPQRPLFQGLSLQAPPGVTLVRGGDGCGKTSLLRLLAGQLPSLQGCIRLNGVALATDRSAYLQQVFWQNPSSADFDAITAQQYWASQRDAYPMWSDAVLAQLTLGLSLQPHMDKPLYMLSTGSKRKVWIAAALASGAALTLLDDPLAALDKASIGFVLAHLRAAALAAQRIYVVAHYQPLEDVPLAATVDLSA